MELKELGSRAKTAEKTLATLDSGRKTQILLAIAEAILERKYEILEANQIDIVNAQTNGMKQALLDRLILNERRVDGMAEGLHKIARLDDPIGEVIQMQKRPNGLLIGRKRVPIGVIGIIYEARPNVTSDAFALCFKSGNAVILKGGKDAIHSNKKIIEILRDTLREYGCPEDVVLLIENTDRSATTEFMKMNEYVDVLIPRGRKELIQTVVLNSTIPVIETGTGNCHIYVDSEADLNMAVQIVENAKTQRVGVCNACESLVVHKSVLSAFLPRMMRVFREHQVVCCGDESVRELEPEILPATEEDWGREYLDYKISIKTVNTIEEAITHINLYNTKHSEAIITENYSHAQRFLDEIDAAAVYVNASTRFTDGDEFGFGAEIGISTQKLHARGPMGLKELTTLKYIIYGSGQIR